MPNLLEFKHVSFGYNPEKMILKDVCFNLETGKKYALVGPTGGGKTTTAGLMVRLYDPTEGLVMFNQKDIRTYQPSQLAHDIGFILQEPFLFTGTVGQNIRYGNNLLENSSDEQLSSQLENHGLFDLMDKFDKGLKTEVTDNAENISLGQKQIIAFIRILLRQPKLLILDEATANIDTITEQQLAKIIAKLPSSTTQVIIAHRLNTIRGADQILFINGGKVKPAINFEDAVKQIENNQRNS